VANRQRWHLTRDRVTVRPPGGTAAEATAVAVPAPPSAPQRWCHRPVNGRPWSGLRCAGRSGL